MKDNHRLYDALMHGKREVAEAIFMRNPNVDMDTFNCLHNCIIFKKFDMMELLFQHNVNVNYIGAGGQSPLFIALVRRQLEIVDRLIKCGADLNLPGPNPPLFCSQNTPEVTRKLLKYGANPNIVSKNGETALLRCISEKKLEIVDILLDNGADVDCVDNDGYTPLIKAVEMDCVEGVRRLLKAGASKEILTPSGKTIHQLAINRNNSKIIKLILSNSFVLASNEINKNCSNTNNSNSNSGRSNHGNGWSVFRMFRGTAPADSPRAPVIKETMPLALKQSGDVITPKEIQYSAGNNYANQHTKAPAVAESTSASAPYAVVANVNSSVVSSAVVDYTYMENANNNLQLEQRVVSLEGTVVRQAELIKTMRAEMRELRDELSIVKNNQG